MTADEPLTITAAAARIRGGSLTPSELLEQCLRRIDVYEPAVQAWVYLDRERARRDAERLTAEVKAGQYRGSLHGIPIGVKDIIDVFDMPTGCGSKLWANSYARRDATVVERLRAAGALILGKTVTTAYAFTDPPKTRNPWNLTRTPGGSSSGSAAAVACGMCLAALGTQTGGSLTRPASYCGVYSLKPTHGRVSVEGVLPLAWSLDHVGVMANCVRDLAVVFEAIAGGDGDEYHGDFREDPTEKLFAVPNDPPDTRLLRIDGFFEDAAVALREMLTDMLSTKAIVLPTQFADVAAAHWAIMSTEAARFHNDRQERHPDDYPPRITQLIEDGRRLTATDYVSAVHLRSRLMERINNILHGRNFFLTPATVDVAPTPETTGDPRFNSPWSFCRTPTIGLPFSPKEEGGLPMSLQLIGACKNEVGLFREAASLEQRLNHKHRLPPVPA